MVIGIKLLFWNFKLNVRHEGEFEGVATVFKKLIDRSEAEFGKNIREKSFKPVTRGCIEFKPLVGDANLFVGMKLCDRLVEFAVRN